MTVRKPNAGRALEQSALPRDLSERGLASDKHPMIIQTYQIFDLKGAKKIMSTLGYNPFAGTGRGGSQHLRFPAHSRVSSGEPPCLAPPAEICALVVRAAKNEWFQQPALCRFQRRKHPRPAPPFAPTTTGSTGCAGEGCYAKRRAGFRCLCNQAAVACCSRGCPGECLSCQKFSR